MGRFWEGDEQTRKNCSKGVANKGLYDFIFFSSLNAQVSMLPITFKRQISICLNRLLDFKHWF